MADEEKQSIPCKVVLIGESGVGKTSIISTYISNTFSSVLMATPGANFTRKIIFLQDENQSLNLKYGIHRGKKNIVLSQKFFIKMQQYVF